MKIKLYPADQLQRYLLIDIIVCILLFYQVLTAEGPFGFFGDLLLLGLFLILFYMGLWYRDWRLLLAVLGGCAFMAVLGIFYNEILLLFGIIFADFLGRARSKLYIFIGMIGFIVTYMVTNFYVHEDSLYFIHTPHLPMLIIQLVVPVVIHMLEGSKLLRRELASANERIDRYVQEEERQRLARDLHDTLGQTLTMIKVKSELAMRLLDKDPELARGEMQEVLHTSRSALKQVRDLVTSMKYVSLEEEFQLGRELLTSSGVQCKVSRSNDQPMLILLRSLAAFPIGGEGRLFTSPVEAADSKIPVCFWRDREYVWESHIRNQIRADTNVWPYMADQALRGRCHDLQ